MSSPPPTSITSTFPSAKRSKAHAIAWLPEEHAFSDTMFGPSNPKSSESRVVMDDGGYVKATPMSNPLALSSGALRSKYSKGGSSPARVPIAIPNLSLSYPVISFRPLSPKASFAAE